MPDLQGLCETAGNLLGIRVARRTYTSVLAEIQFFSALSKRAQEEHAQLYRCYFQSLIDNETSMVVTEPQVLERALDEDGTKP